MAGTASSQCHRTANRPPKRSARTALPIVNRPTMGTQYVHRRVRAGCAVIADDPSPLYAQVTFEFQGLRQPVMIRFDQATPTL